MKTKVKQSTAKEDRCDRANALLQIIGNTGRKFFRHKGRVSQFSLDERGRVWFADSWNQEKIYTHYHGRWMKFSEGGTMKNLIESLRDYIMQSKELHPRTFGPWPKHYCGGDLWGYGDDMMAIRMAGAALNITFKLHKE